ncbi:MAG: hypothetical protein K0S53_3042 [Bacteroidetes bacterium]|jgi:hypothetical protein|nr:hypothetical protein [Bacteroidota bacterium]
MSRRVFNQLFHEFKWQFVIAIIWATYRTYNSEKDYLSTFLSNFSAAFFFLSWIFSQLLRVQKQQKLESDFTQVKEDIMGFSIGKNSTAYFMPVQMHQNILNLHIHLANNSKYPTYDINGYYIDLDELKRTKGHNSNKHNFKIGDIFPTQVLTDVFILPMQERDRVNIEIKYNTRSGTCLEEIIAIKVGEKINIAFKVHSNNKTVTNIPSDFPGLDPNNPESIFFDHKL